MNDRELEPVIRRILVALDASTHSLAALEAASALAETFEAELVGIFVEDINLLRLAGLPFAREVRYQSSLDRPLDSPSLERGLRVQAEQMRQALAGAAERRRLQWSFRVVRGQVAAELLTAAQEADLLALGRASWPSSRRVRLGGTARLVVANASRAVLLLQCGHAVCSPLIAVYDGSAGAQRALITAARLLPATGGHLTVIVVTDTAEAAASLGSEAAELLQGRRVQIHGRHLVNPTAEHLAHAIHIAGGGTLVISAESPLVEAGGLQTVLEAIDCSALLVR
jgi:nucleotide-binding universal stress UspA family protein